MPDPHQPDSAIREELVAYLDGELSPEESRAVEERLARDAAYRREMQGFDRAWNALEELPQATVDDAFTKTTIEMVTVVAQRDVAQLTQTLPAIRRRRAWWIAGIAAVAATLGFALARVVLDHPNRVLLTNLPVVQVFDAYNQNMSVAFLKQLQADAGEMLQPYEDAELERQVDLLRAIDSATISERRDIVAARSDAEQAALLANHVRFLDLPQERQKQLVELNDRLGGEGGSEDLQRTMLAYWAWMQEQAPHGGEQAELRGAATTDERIAMMRQLDRRSERRITLSPEELSRIREVLQEFEKNPRLERAIERLRESRPAPRESQHRRRPPTEYPFAGVVMLGMMAREHEERPEVARLWEELQQRLSAALTEETRHRIDDWNPGHRAWFLRGAIFQATRAAFQPSEAELESLLTSDAIDNVQLQRLLALPKQEMMDELTRIHIAQELGGDWSDLWRRHGGPPFGRGYRDRDSRLREGRGDDSRRNEERSRGPRAGPPRDDRRPPPPPD